MDQSNSSISHLIQGIKRRNSTPSSQLYEHQSVKRANTRYNKDPYRPFGAGPGLYDQVTNQSPVDLKKFLDKLCDIEKSTQHFIDTTTDQGTKLALQNLMAISQSCGMMLNNTKSICEDAIHDEKRQRSVVILNMPEATGTATQRAEFDRKSVLEIFDKLDIEALPVATFRMGKAPMQPSDNHVNEVGLVAKARPRLLKVEMHGRGITKELLSKRFYLAKIPNMKNIQIRESWTREQRELRAQMINEKNEKNRKLNEPDKEDPYVLYGPAGKWKIIRKSSIRKH